MALNKEVEPILIASVKQNRLQFSTTTFKDILSKVGSRPVSIVSVTHPNANQKNIIFNNFLDYLKTLQFNGYNKNQFVWKSRTENDPKGIYICPEPIIIKKSCQEVAIILMETNGQFGPNNCSRADLMLFALNCVMSSFLIYNLEKGFSNEIQEFLQLFSKYGRGGVGPEFVESYLNMLLLVNDDSYKKKFAFGFHDFGTCPNTGEKPLNYRKVRLDHELNFERKNLKEELAFKNRHFCDSFYKIGFCLMPDPNPNSKVIVDDNENVVSSESVWPKTTVQLFHPSNLAIKHLINKKMNGNQMIELFQQICDAMSEQHIEEETEEELRNHLRDLRALSVGLNHYKSKLDKEIKNKDSLKESHLKRCHDDYKESAIKQFNIVRGTVDGAKRAPDDRIFALLDEEIENVRHFYEELNRFKSESVEGKELTYHVLNEMADEVALKKKQFESAQNGLDFEISQLIGVDYQKLSNAVRSTLLTN